MLFYHLTDRSISPTEINIKVLEVSQAQALLTGTQTMHWPAGTISDRERDRSGPDGKGNEDFPAAPSHQFPFQFTADESIRKATIGHNPWKGSVLCRRCD